MRLSSNSSELQRVIVMSSYYAQWLPKFSDKIKSLTKTQNFSVGKETEDCLKLPIIDLASAALGVIEERLPFVIEIDASKNAISSPLNVL